MEDFQYLLRTRGAIIACILNLEYAQFTFLLLTVYYIFKDCIGRNDV